MAFIRVALEYEDEFTTLLSVIRNLETRSHLVRRHLDDLRSLTSPVPGKTGFRQGAIQAAFPHRSTFASTSVTDFSAVDAASHLTGTSRELFVAAIEELRCASEGGHGRIFGPQVVIDALYDETGGPALEVVLLHARNDFNLMARIQRQVLPAIVRAPVGEAPSEEGAMSGRRFTPIALLACVALTVSLALAGCAGGGTNTGSGSDPAGSCTSGKFALGSVHHFKDSAGHSANITGGKCFDTIDNPGTILNANPAANKAFFLEPELSKSSLHR